MRRIAWIALALGVAWLAPAAAETVELLDGSKLIGEMQHYYDNVLTFATVDGAVKIDRRNLKSIVFKLPDPRPEFATPEKTFELWRSRMAAGDFEGAVAAYALLYQNRIAGELADLPLENRLRMKQEIERTKFAILDVKIDGKKATLKVERKLDENADQAFLNFISENGEWKMTP